MIVSAVAVVSTTANNGEPRAAVRRAGWVQKNYLAARRGFPGAVGIGFCATATVGEIVTVRPSLLKLAMTGTEAFTSEDCCAVVLAVNRRGDRFISEGEWAKRVRREVRARRSCAARRVRWRWLG